MIYVHTRTHIDTCTAFLSIRAIFCGGRGKKMASSTASSLRLISDSEEAWISTSSRCNSSRRNWVFDGGLKRMEELGNVCGGGDGCGCLNKRKRVMVVVDETCYSKHAMMWALTHAANKGDLLTLLHIIPPHSETTSSSCFSDSLSSLCKACEPEVEVEVLVIQGPRLATVTNQVKKLDVSVLVLGQKRPSSLLNCLCGSNSSEKFVEQCINSVECLTIGVSKQSRSVGGYLISTKWIKNFWLLA